MAGIALPSGAGSHEVTLGPGDSCVNPASTKKRIHGPARLVVTNHADGSVRVTVLGG